VLEPLVLDSARKHGVSDDDMLHAFRNVVDVFPLGEGMTMFVGPAYNAAMLEVGVVDSVDGPAIAHAMKARDKYLR
jgi:hypothetical protein